MGGMLTARFAAAYPDLVERAVICNAIGMTDARWSGPWTTAQDAYAGVMKQSNDQNWAGFYATIRRYFPGDSWKPEYDKFVRILYAPSLSADWPRLAMVRAIFQRLPYLDPVVYDWPHIKARTLMIGGEKDYDGYPDDARRAAKAIPNGELVLIPNVGHVPHIQVPEVFERELLKFLQ
jgi:pimeloyl-ACP methyl ester carboxylesterase